MFSDVFDILLEALNKYASNKYPELMDSFHPFAITLLTLFIVIFGYKVLKGDFGKDTKQALTTMILVVMVSELVFNYDIYYYWVIETIIDLLLKLTSFFLAIDKYNSEELFESVDLSFSMIFKKIEQIIENASIISDFGIIFGMMLLGILGGILYCLFSVLIMVGVFFVFLFLTIGGITMFFFPFEKTRFITISWFRSLTNYALYPVFTGFVMGITLFLLEGVVKGFSEIPVNDLSIFSLEYGSLVFIILLSSYFHWKVPDICSSITGGSPSGLGEISNLGRGVHMAGTATSNMMARYSGKGGQSIMSKIGSKS